jgi:hypothetical protein
MAFSAMIRTRIPGLSRGAKTCCGGASRGHAVMVGVVDMLWWCEKWTCRKIVTVWVEGVLVWGVMDGGGEADGPCE